MNNGLVTLLLYEKRTCWSNIAHKYFVSDDIANQFWYKEGIRLKCLQVTLGEAIDIVLKNPGKTKAERNAMWIIQAPECPDKEKYGLENWSGYIWCDLDMQKSPLISKLNKTGQDLLYKRLKLALKELLPNNFRYIEHSSSGIGIHCMFYFDCEHNEENFKKFTKYIYNIFRYSIDDYIKDFSHIFTMPECLKSNGKSEVFDEVYKRPYQKLFLTGIDYELYECSGKCDEIEVEVEPDKSYKPETDTTGKINITYTSRKKWDLDHNDRFYVLTALKRYCDKDTAYKLWYDFCQDISLYKNYTTKKFINMFETYWDNKLDPSTGHISILKKYGFKVDDSEIHYYLNEDEWLEKVFPDIIKNCEYGINMSIAGTGVGKNHSLILMNDKWRDPLEISMHKPVMVIEPLNSIIESKYDEQKFRIVTGSKHIGNVSQYEMIITNYNHLVKRTIEGEYEIIDNLKDFFGKFELIIIDESHIMLKDVFRSDVLVQFIKTLSRIKSTKILIQTATPMFEKSVLDIKKTFIIHKPEKSKKKIIFREWKEEEIDGKKKSKSILDLTCLADYYITNGKKVYIYWSNGSSQQMKMFKENYHDPDKVAIYHKRLTGEADMTYITENHLLEDKDILISSCYFGVGNDLNDEIENAAVIIIGNNPWQEDIQAIGRWRNTKYIECCIILDKYEMEVINESSYSFSELLKKSEYELSRKWNDKMIRDKSVTIHKMTYMIHEKSDIFYLARMNAAYQFSDQFDIKCEEFERMGYDVRRTIKPLVSNPDYSEQLKEWRNKRKKIHNELIYDMVNNDIFNYEEINKDSKMSRVARVIKKLKANNLLRLADVNSVSSILKYDSYIRYLGVNFKDEYDYAELFSIIWTRNAIKNNTINCKELAHGEETKKISMNDYLIICGYLIWWSYRNKTDNEVATCWNYYSTFKRTVNDFLSVSDELIEKLFDQHYGNDEFNEEYNEFFNHFFSGQWNEHDIESMKPKKQLIEKDLLNEIKKIKISEKDYGKLFWKLVGICSQDKKEKAKETGKIGGEISSKRKQIKDLETGKIYASVTECAKNLGISVPAVSKNKSRFVIP